MNKLFIIGNLTRDPELRSVSSGIPVATFTVAVNRRRSSNAEAGQQPEADFFRVTAWRQLGENCNRYLAKGRKVAVVGSVQVSTYTANDGTTRASLEVTADDVEFLSPRGEGDGGSGYQAEQSSSQSTGGTNSGFVKVDDEELPF
ncbi:MAG: single-stranded DNA-binding protein [Clostridiales bacterium]|nr:single-stranded DNA-binding protein [Clostridiales bacterium]